MFDNTDAPQFMGRELRSTDGEKVGVITQVYLDDETGAPEWFTVDTGGLFGGKERFVPLAGARDEGGVVIAEYTKERIKDAPGVAKDGHLSEDDERVLYEHYGLFYGGTDTYTTETGQAGVVGQGDDAMTRSEQQLDVGTERVETGRARLRKWVEEETVQVDVPITRERAVVVTEPITDANRDAAYAGAELTESEHEVTLTEERPVVTKETVPVERVRLEKDVETDVRAVEETVAKERIEVEGDVDKTRNRH